MVDSTPVLSLAGFGFTIPSYSGVWVFSSHGLPWCSWVYSVMQWVVPSFLIIFSPLLVSQQVGWFCVSYAHLPVLSEYEHAASWFPTQLVASAQ